MKNILTTILLIGLLFVSYSSYSQNAKWSFRANTGISKIPLTSNSDDDIFFNFENQEGKFAFSWSYGSQIERQIKKNLFLRAGLNFSVFKDKRINKVELLFGPGPIIDPNPNPNLGEIIQKYTIKSSNISIPVSLNFKAKKIGFNLGIQSQYFIGAEMTFEQTASGSARDIVDDSKATAPIEFKKFDFGALGGISYDLNSFLTFHSEVYWGLRNIIEDINSFGNELERKNRRISIGVSYHFARSNNLVND